MELQFEKRVMPCLRRVLREYQTQEQTQEVRLPEGMPDIGTVLSCWGQVILRGKEWRGDSIGVSGGVTARVLYLPEGGGAPQSLEVWLPFQMKWSIPQTTHDGTILASALLRAADARSLSARKLMVRTNVGMLAEASVPEEAELFSPVEVPEDVRLLQRSYPVCIPKEAGEKSFMLDETLEIGTGEPKIDKLMRCALQPEIIEKKLMADKVIFRGLCIVHILYRAEDGQLYSRDLDVPFSQYAELEGEYDPEARVRLIPAVTNLELEQLAEEQLHLKANLTGQYMIYETPLVELVEDAYSPLRTVTPIRQTLQLPAVLDMDQQVFHARVDSGVDMQRCADVAFMPEPPYLGREGDQVEAEVGGTFQLLYYDPEGQLNSTLVRWEDQWNMEADTDSRMEAVLLPSGKPQASPTDSMLQADAVMGISAGADSGLDMVTALELGQPAEPDPKRPSLVLQKAGSQSLWELAKGTGSTVEAIMKANGLQQEPEADRILLIPIP